MQDFQQRVIDERQSLVEKIEKLSPFMEGDIFRNLPADEQERLQRQLGIMNQYAGVLGERIQEFPR